jgi:hypothetical protein
MSINLAELSKIAKDFATWYSVAAAAIGVAGHKAYLWLKAKLAAAEADAKKVAADAAAAVKKL